LKLPERLEIAGAMDESDHSHHVRGDVIDEPVALHINLTDFEGAGFGNQATTLRQRS
jgi:hypothetical protein